MSEKRIMFFCLGNICRSPLAEGLFKYHVEQRGLLDRFHIESSGTSGFHAGEKPDPGSIKIARERLGLDISDQRSQQLTADHLASFDHVVAMDASNRANALRLQERDIVLLRDFEPDPEDRGKDVPDPWGYDGKMFGHVYDVVYRCTERFLDTLV